jgi:hypothetical protein
MIEVGRFDTRADAELARSLLAAARIPCILAPDTASGDEPIDLSSGARLLVAEGDAHDAVEILRHHEPAGEIADEHLDAGRSGTSDSVGIATRRHGNGVFGHDDDAGS